MHGDLLDSYASIILSLCFRSEAMKEMIFMNRPPVIKPAMVSMEQEK